MVGWGAVRWDGVNWRWGGRLAATCGRQRVVCGGTEEETFSLRHGVGGADRLAVTPLIAAHNCKLQVDYVARVLLALVR